MGGSYDEIQPGRIERDLSSQFRSFQLALFASGMTLLRVSVSQRARVVALVSPLPSLQEERECLSLCGVIRIKRGESSNRRAVPPATVRIYPYEAWPIVREIEPRHGTVVENPKRISFNELRDRAYELADTGRYADWHQVAAALDTEGYDEAARRLTADPILTTLLNTRCWQAQHKG
jgi:hypothetical protein